MEFWRTCGFPPKGGKDFDKPRCREASRSVGPAGPKASRAPSVFEASGGIAIREGLPGADIKNTGDDARLDVAVVTSPHLAQSKAIRITANTGSSTAQDHSI